MKGTVTKAKKQQETMRTEYDFSKAVRGKYAKAFNESSNVIVLEPDVAARFKNSRAVNETLRAILRVADQAQG